MSTQSCRNNCTQVKAGSKIFNLLILVKPANFKLHMVHCQQERLRIVFYY